ncbi:hypothetical protein C475_10368 [Halosimplex carlsbadense 2-9-1]|uniref:DUF8055 domain-containing protein n=1 Tax=Halosimplex carlsbadense 2-9-1 TaxID=797114 RepID=M0CQS8_9EURY|nr:hypothetical protein [Halosimplex carlsbadense]ELZ25600.1 hypothetical protein C475_10368 [Halosimplex carlsbadense 2-9-1]
MPSEYRARIDDLAEEAAAARASFDPPADPPDEERALAVCREGVGAAVAVYVDARTGEWHRFGEAEFDRLERALNTHLELYARCYGVEIDPDHSVRTAAEALLDTHNVVDVAQILTGVPDRDDE